MTRVNSFFTCKAFCPEMIEDTVKIGEEALNDKIGSKLIGTAAEVYVTIAYLGNHRGAALLRRHK